MIIDLFVFVCPLFAFTHFAVSPQAATLAAAEDRFYR